MAKNSDKWQSATNEKHRHVKLRRRTLQKKLVGMNKKKQRGNPLVASLMEEEE
jgi:hypothetical protein